MTPELRDLVPTPAGAQEMTGKRRCGRAAVRVVHVLGTSGAIHVTYKRRVGTYNRGRAAIIVSS